MVKQNIPLIYAISALMWMRFFIPVLALFYIASQVTYQEFAIIMGLFAFATFIFEIPSGIIADLIGKKKTLLIARFLYIIEIILISFFNGFWVFLFAKLISGIGVSLNSGTAEALLYDTLKKQRKEKKHKQILGTKQLIVNISMAISFSIGAVLFAIYYKLPAYLSLIPITIGFVLTFFIVEPYESKNSTFKHHISQSFLMFKKNHHAKFITLYAAGFGAIASILLSMFSAYYELISLPVWTIGFIAFIGSLLIGFGAKLAHRVTLSEKKQFLFLSIAIIISQALMIPLIPFIGAAPLLVLSFLFGFFLVLTTNYINEYIPKSHRASLISIKNFFPQVIIFIIFPLSGIVGFFLSFIIFTIILIINYIWCFCYAKKHSIFKNSF